MVLEDKIWNQVLEIRHRLHSCPEISMKEFRTASYIEGILKELGLQVEKIQDIGLIATLKIDDEGPVVAIRAEMDALPIQEETGLPFASGNPGVMHACGHDAIVASAMGVILYLVEHREEFHGTYRFLFEPGEEVGQGAKLLIDAGGLENPRPDALLIFHFANDLTDGMEIQKDVSTAAVGGVTVWIHGKSCHFSERQKGVDAILAAGEVLHRIGHIQSTFDCGMPFVLGFGLIQGGKKANIMADEVTLQGSIRTFTDESFQKLYGCLEKELQEAQELTGAGITIELNRTLPAFRNDKRLVELGMKAGKKVFGEAAVLGEHPFLVGDNASLYLAHVPGLRMVFFAGKENEEHFPIHHSKFDIEEKAMKKTIFALIELLKEMQV